MHHPPGRTLAARSACRLVERVLAALPCPPAAQHRTSDHKGCDLWPALHCDLHQSSSKSTADKFLASATGQILSPILVWVPHTVQSFSILHINMMQSKQRLRMAPTLKSHHNLLIAPDLRMPAKDTATSAPTLLNCFRNDRVNSCSSNSMIADRTAGAPVSHCPCDRSECFHLALFLTSLILDSRDLPWVSSLMRSRRNGVTCGPALKDVRSRWLDD
jgi:hypothetical protein